MCYVDYNTTKSKIYDNSKNNIKSKMGRKEVYCIIFLYIIHIYRYKVLNITWR